MQSTFFDLAVLNAEIGHLLEVLNGKTMRHVGRSRRELLDEIERAALKALPVTSFEYAEWKTAKVHPDYHVAVGRNFYLVPHGLIGRKVDMRLTQRVVEIFQDHKRVASHVHSSQRGLHITVNAHMPKAHQRYADRTPTSLIKRAARMGTNVAVMVERMMREPSEQSYRLAMGILSLGRGYGHVRLDAACDRALAIEATTYASVLSILKSGLDQASPAQEPIRPAPSHGSIRGGVYYQ